MALISESIRVWISSLLQMVSKMFWNFSNNSEKLVECNSGQGIARYKARSRTDIQYPQIYLWNETVSSRFLSDRELISVKTGMWVLRVFEGVEVLLRPKDGLVFLWGDGWCEERFWMATPLLIFFFWIRCFVLLKLLVASSSGKSFLNQVLEDGHLSIYKLYIYLYINKLT